jgi:hypothetical protein
LAQLPDAVDLIGFGWFEMPVENTFLRVPDTTSSGSPREFHRHSNRRRFRAFKRRNRFVPTCNTPSGSFGSKLIPDLAPPIAGPETENLTSMVLANESTSFMSSPLRIRVPPPAAIAAQRVDDRPAFGFGFGILPVEYDFGFLVFEFFE